MKSSKPTEPKLIAGVMLQRALLRRVDAVAVTLRRSRSSVMAEAVEQFVEKQEKATAQRSER